MIKVDIQSASPVIPHLVQLLQVEGRLEAGMRRTLAVCQHLGGWYGSTCAAKRAAMVGTAVKRTFAIPFQEHQKVFLETLAGLVDDALWAAEDIVGATDGMGASSGGQLGLGSGEAHLQNGRDGATILSESPGV